MPGAGRISSATSKPTEIPIIIYSNELSSTLALTDDSGNVTDEFAYMPYGYANHTPHAGSTDTPFQWLGGYGVYYDSATDLHLTLHRAYSFSMKCFIHPDPLGIDGGVNVYAIANRNPLAFVDPYGLCADAIAGFENDLNRYYRDLSEITGQKKDFLRDSLSKMSWGAVVGGLSADGLNLTKAGKDLYWIVGGGTTYQINRLGEIIDFGAKGAGVAAIGFDGVLGVANLAHGDYDKAGDNFWSMSAGATAIVVGGPIGWGIGLSAAGVNLYNNHLDNQIRKYDAQRMDALIFSIQYTNQKLNQLNEQQGRE